METAEASIDEGTIKGINTAGRALKKPALHPPPTAAFRGKP